jgi:DNA-binding transcriptional ArsR family regulator
MVKCTSPLDATFAALSDPTRRGILEQLSQGRTRVTDLAEHYAISLPAVSKHLKVLESAGLITRTRVGKEHRIQVDPAPIIRARDWISMYARVWQHQFDKLDQYLERAQQRAPTSADFTGR